MYDVIPSAYMEKLFAENEFELNDMQKATILWNASHMTWEEKLC